MGMQASDTLGKYVLHTPSGVIGRVKKVHSKGTFNAVTVEVVEFEDGNSFVWATDSEDLPSTFLLLDDHQQRFYLQMQAVLQHMIVESVKLGMALQLNPAEGTRLLISVLQRQTRALEAI
jgi:hypothetical protein